MKGNDWAVSPVSLQDLRSNRNGAKAMTETRPASEDAPNPSANQNPISGSSTAHLALVPNVAPAGCHRQCKHNSAGSGGDGVAMGASQIASTLVRLSCLAVTCWVPGHVRHGQNQGGGIIFPQISDTIQLSNSDSGNPNAGNGGDGYSYGDIHYNPVAYVAATLSDMLEKTSRGCAGSMSH